MFIKGAAWGLVIKLLKSGYVKTSSEVRSSNLAPRFIMHVVWIAGGSHFDQLGQTVTPTGEGAKNSGHWRTDGSGGASLSMRPEALICAPLGADVRQILTTQGDSQPPEPIS